jgi:curved DNA-binding protein CbpA
MDGDPWAVLDIPQDADDGRIRSAYLRKVKEFPPDRDEAGFQRIRDAYEELRDPRRRCRRLVLAADPAASLTSLLDDQPDVRRYVGPGPWLEALSEK